MTSGSRAPTTSRCFCHDTQMNSAAYILHACKLPIPWAALASQEGGQQPRVAQERLLQPCECVFVCFPDPCICLTLQVIPFAQTFECVQRGRVQAQCAGLQAAQCPLDLGALREACLPAGAVRHALGYQYEQLDDDNLPWRRVQGRHR